MTRIPRGTFNCCYKHARQNLSAMGIWPAESMRRKATVNHLLRIIHERVAGLDVHKKTVVATRMRITADERLDWETQTFGTTTPDLLTLHDCWRSGRAPTWRWRARVTTGSRCTTCWKTTLRCCW